LLKQKYLSEAERMLPFAGLQSRAAIYGGLSWYPPPSNGFTP